ncbi:hypothetical protein C4573_01045 [Candidatus Woesearchaeota archaeon]|nr:MAG: hypothetical protein C4573_01045 [Candidatus Woesearchaeota archaeon]
MLLAKTLSHYKRDDVQRAIADHALHKEVAVLFQQGFGKRPDTLHYANDVLELAKKGALSFHASEELWSNPLALATSMRKQDLDSLRRGWDLIIDVDCKIFSYSKIAAYYIVKFLKSFGISAITIKFSGNKGFHIAIPFEAFPEKIGSTETKNLFPEAPQRIALLIKESIKQPVADAITKLEKNDLTRIVEKIKDKSAIVTTKTKEGSMMMLNVDPFLAIDTVLISSRHLYRMPYSFHEKSGLISVPFDANAILQFDKKDAMLENVVVKYPFLDRNVKKGEAASLLREAFDFKPRLEVTVEKKYVEAEEKVNVKEDFFPPCIQKILLGMEDGRKRALFILINFFGSIGWDYSKIEETILAWNKKNKEPLRDTYVMGQLRYAKVNKKKILPPNCNNQAYYKDLNVCCPDDLCKRVKNPVNYAKRKARMMERNG